MRNLIVAFLMVSLLIQCAGCSWIFMKRVPEEYDPSRELDCSGYGFPIADGVLSGLQIALVAIGSSRQQPSSVAGMQMFWAIIIGLESLVLAASSTTGFFWAHTCGCAEEDHSWWLNSRPPLEIRAREESALQAKWEHCTKLKEERSKRYGPRRAHGLPVECRKFLRQGINPDTLLGLTALHRAANRGDEKELGRLVESGADVGARDRYGWTPLHWAASSGSVEANRILADAGAEVDARDARGATPLLNAAFAGNTPVVGLLLSRGARVNAQNDRGFTPLHAAAIQGHTGTAKILLSKGAKINGRTYNGRTPIGLAEDNGHKKLSRLLRKARVKLKSARRDRWKMKSTVQPDRKEAAKRSPTQEEERLEKPETKMLSCPAGTEMIGSPPPDGWEQYCARQDNEGNPVKHGWFNSWFENGYPASAGAYQDGKRHGRWTFWYSNGRKRLEAEYLDDKKHGRWTFWERDGSKQKEAEYRDDAEAR